MSTEKILVAILFLAIILAVFYILMISRRLNECRKEMENLYILRRTDLAIAGKTLKITYGLTYSKRNMPRTERGNLIRDHFEINDYGTPGFDKMPWRQHLANHGFRNIRIVER